MILSLNKEIIFTKEISITSCKSHHSDVHTDDDDDDGDVIVVMIMIPGSLVWPSTHPVPNRHSKQHHQIPAKNYQEGLTPLSLW